MINSLPASYSMGNYKLSIKNRNKTGMSAFTPLFQHNTESLSHSNRQEEIKGIHIGKEEIKLSLCADDMILYIANQKFHQETIGTDK